MENEHNELTKEAVEALMSSIFGEMLTLAKKYDITVKRMRDLLLVQQMSELQQQGLNQLEMMAASGYTRRWIKKILTDPPASQRNSLAKFVSDWARDPEFPDELPISGQYPSFGDICERYGKDYTEPALRKILRERGITHEVNKTVVLNRHCKVSTNVGINAICSSKETFDALLRSNKQNPLAKFISDWATDPEFPDVLPLNGPHPSFESVYERYGKSYSLCYLRKILNEKGITYEVNGSIALGRHRQVTYCADIDKIYAAKKSMCALFQTLKRNLNNEQPTFTERRIWSDNIPSVRVPELRERMRGLNARHAMSVLKLLEEYQEERHDSTEEEWSVVGLGMYWYECN